jgi:tetratricopeptide (TPR) repeat protein
MVWDAASGRSLYRRATKNEAASRIALDPTGKRLAIAMAPFTPEGENHQAAEAPFVAVIDVDSGEELLHHDLRDEQVLALGFSGDGRRLAAAGVNRTALIWDVETRQLLTQSRQGPEQAMDLTFSPDGRRLAIASRKQVTLVDAETAEEVLMLRGRAQLKPNNHGFNPRVRFSPDGLTLFGICDDGYDQLAAWSITGGEPDRHDWLLRCVRRRAVRHQLGIASRLSVSSLAAYHLGQAEKYGLERPWQYLKAAEIHAALGLWNNVEDDLNKAVSLAPGHEETVARAAITYADRGFFQHAGTWFSRLTSLPPSLGANYALAFLLSGDQTRYRQFREQLWNRVGTVADPGPVGETLVVFSCAQGQGAINDPAGLVRLAQHAREHVLLAGGTESNQALALLGLGAAHLRSGSPSLAEPYFRQEIARAPGEASRAAGWAWLATCLLHQGRHDEARTWFDQADRFVRAHVPGGRPELEHPAPDVKEASNWWWDLLLAWREAQGLLLDEQFPVDAFAP